MIEYATQSCSVSEIYSTVAQNSVVQARPSVLHFGGFEVGKTHTATLQLANVSTEVQRMHVIPPQTHYFYIKYTKNVRANLLFFLLNKKYS